MRAVALHEDVIVFVSDVWQTTCTAVRGDDEGFVIDSPIYPEELRALPEVLEQAEFPVSGLLATHGDWDHLLGRLAFPGAALGGAESTVARLAPSSGTRSGGCARSTRSTTCPSARRSASARCRRCRSRRLEIGTRGGPASGARESGARSAGATSGRELELLAADGHTGDGAAYWMGWARVLVCGDYLSPVEIPMLSTSAGGSLAAYRATLARLSGLVANAEWIVPGHGAPLSSRRADEILREDDHYLADLERDPATARPPASRARTVSQRRIHADNVTSLTPA